MSLILFIPLVLVVLALAAWALQALPFIDAPIKQIILVIFIVLAIAAILGRFPGVAIW